MNFQEVGATRLHPPKLPESSSWGCLGFRVYSPPEVDRIWGIRGSYSNIPKAIVYLLKGDYSVGGWFRVQDLGLGV